MAKNKSEKRRHTPRPNRRAPGKGRGAKGAIPSVASDLFQQTAGAVQTALNLQDEWVRSWADFVDQSARLVNSQQQWQRAVMASVPAAQRSIEASMEMIERTSRAGMAWMQTALDFAAAPGAVLEAGTRAQELTRRSVEFIQTGVRAVADAHRDAVESWGSAIQDGGEVAKAAARSVEEVGRLTRATARKTARSSAEAARDLTRSTATLAEQSTRAAISTAEKAA